MKDLGRLSRGLLFEDLVIGTKWHTAGRTLNETDLVSFINLTWFTEDLFTNQHDRKENAIPGRPVPAGMIFTMAEGLILPSLERAGLAFLHTDIDVKSPTFLGDTIYVNCEVIETKECKKPDRGLVRTKNTVTNAIGDTVLIYHPLRLIKRRS